jgi:hypothetical protein
MESNPVCESGVSHIHKVLHFPEATKWPNLRHEYELHPSILTHTCFCCKDEFAREIVVCAVQQTGWEQWVPVPMHCDAVYVFFNLFVWHELKWDQLYYMNIRVPTAHFLRPPSTGWVQWLRLSLPDRLNCGGSPSPLTPDDGNRCSFQNILYIKYTPGCGQWPT